MEWLQNNRNLMLIEGIIFVILGFLAVALPGISTLSAELFIGWLLIFGGIVQLYRTFKGHHERPEFIGSLLTGFLYLIFGILLILFPLAGIFSLTILLMIFFLAEGIAKIFFGFKLRPASPWGWLIVNGILAIIMAGIIWAGWPGTAYWVLGLLVGINMIFFGITLIFLSLGMPRTKANP